MPVVVVATITPKPEDYDAVVEILSAGITRTHAEDDGCQLYALHTVEGRLVMIEKWSDDATLDSHMAGPIFTGLAQQLNGKLAARPDIQRLAPIFAGNRELGAL